jgi:hypothetical protein
MDCRSFSTALSRLGVVDAEAAEIFKTIDKDGSGDVSLDEFRNALREVAPVISIECFWQRFAAQWPQLCREAAKGGVTARQRAGTLLLELLPRDVRQRCIITEISDHADKSEQPTVRPSFVAFTFEMFNAFASSLDISRANAQDLFQKIAMSSTLRRRPSLASRRTGFATSRNTTNNLDESAREVDLEDFLEELQLWTDRIATDTKSGGNVSNCQPEHTPFSEIMGQMLAPSKAAISAFKAQLAPPVETWNAQDKASSRCTVRPRRLSKPPWQSFSASRRPSVA